MGVYAPGLKGLITKICSFFFTHKECGQKQTSWMIDLQSMQPDIEQKSINHTYFALQNCNKFW